MGKQDLNEFAALRTRSGLSLEDTAQLLGKTPRTLYRWENDEIEPPKMAIALMRAYVEGEERFIRKSGAKFRFIDLFAGIGGIRMAFEGIQGKCVFTSEWNDKARQTYQANFPLDHPIAGDITKIHAAEIPSHDVLLAGFPCQPFSIAGVSKKNALGRAHGFLDETQGTLFFDVARIIQYHQPAAFLLENVKNLVSHDKGRTFTVIKSTLEELGYTLSCRVINAKGFLPQNRQRIFIAGFREDTGFDMNNIPIPAAEIGPTLKTILHPEDGSEEPELAYTDIRGKVLPKYTLTENLWEYLQAYAEKHKKQGNGFGFGLCGPDDVARTLSARYYKDGSEILIKQPRKRPRRLTPRECARLMGFDQPGYPRFNIPVSDTQAYKQFGNSVAVPVVEVVAEHMYSHILKAMKSESKKADLLVTHG